MIIWTWLRELDPRIWQAVIAGTFVALGWVFNGWQNRRTAAALRAERLRDTHRALFAEIANNLSNLWNEDSLDEFSALTIEKMCSDPDYVPFIPKERNDRLFDTIQNEINILPRVTIDPVVRYYTLIDTLAAFVDDMRGDAFKELESERRIAMYEDYTQMRKQVLVFGQIANSLIKIYSEQGKDAAEEAAAKLSVPSSLPSDRSAT